MKVYVISNVVRGTDSIVQDFMDANVNVISKEHEHEVEEMSADAVKAIEGGNADYVVVIADDPIKASMLFNKERNLYAALCSSVEDVELAKSNNANTIIVNSAMPRDALVDSLLGSGKSFGFLQKKKRESQEPEQPKKQNVQIAKQQKSKSKQEEDEENTVEHSNKGGLLGMLKDSLGIIDKK